MGRKSTRRRASRRDRRIAKQREWSRLPKKVGPGVCGHGSRITIGHENSGTCVSVDHVALDRTRKESADIAEKMARKALAEYGEVSEESVLRIATECGLKRSTVRRAVMLIRQLGYGQEEQVP